MIKRKDEFLIMTVATKYLGDVKVESKDIIHFKNGLPGFITENKFMLMTFPENPIFQILQSLNTPELAFIVTDPYHFYHDYTFKLDETILRNLKIVDPKDVVVLTIVTLISPVEQSTINLKAPIIINRTQNLGKQYILNNENYQTKAPIVPPKASQAKGE